MLAFSNHRGARPARSGPKNRPHPGRLFVPSVLAVIAALLAPSPAATSSLRRTAFVKAVERVMPSVVSIQGRKSVPAEQGRSGETFRQVNGMGTGIVIDPRGYVLTNYHVVEGVSRIQVRLHDQKTVIGQLVNHDAHTDLAVIKITVDGKLPVIDVGTSSDLMLGEPVFAIGNALGYSHSLSDGIVSQLHRTVAVSDDQQYEDVIQTNADINPGNSGGPLINIDGQMIGVNAAVRIGASGIAFAIPVDAAMEVAARLMSAEEISNVEHGIRGKSRTADDESQFIVSAILPGSAAQKAGIEPGDVITEVAELPISRGLDLERAMIGRAAGEQIELSILRGGQTREASLELQPAKTRQAGALSERIWQVIGVRLSPVPQSALRVKSSKAHQYHGGMKVLAVRTGSPASQQGIESGDVLIGLHRWETTSFDNLAYILDSPEWDEANTAKFFIVRNEEPLYGYLRTK